MGFAFVGSVPELYDRHLGPVLFEPYALEVARRLPAGTRSVLEIAAGTGRVTRQLLAALPKDGALLATDLNPDMMAIGTRLVGDDPRLTWQAADAQSLPVADGGFDAVVCQFGLMFVPDKALALREMRRVLRPGGTLLLSTWDSFERNPAPRVVGEHVRAALPSNPPTFMEVPFSMNDPGVLGRLVEAARFAEVRVDTVAFTGESVSAADLAAGMVRGNPLIAELRERGIDVDAFERDLASEFTRRFGAAPCRVPQSAHIVTAN